MTRKKVRTNEEVAAIQKLRLHLSGAHVDKETADRLVSLIERLQDGDVLGPELCAIGAELMEIQRKIEIAVPFFQSWKERYGRRIPLHEVDVFLKRIDHEMNQIKEKKQQIVDKVASKGVTIDLPTLRKNIEKSKAEYKGPDRQGYIQQLDLFLTSLEVKYGTSIPIDEANKLLDKLDEDIRVQRKTPSRS